MMAPIKLNRRSFIVVAGSTTTVALAGCSGDGGSRDDSNGDDQFLNEEPEYSDWFEDVNSYEGTVDRRNEDEVKVRVGAGGNGLAFTPAAVAVSTGTTIVWEWTGEGGRHNVVHRDAAFESEFSDEAGHTFTHSFGEPGTYEYFCEPHEAAGMKGAIYVE